MQADKNKIYTVSDITRDIKAQLEGAFGFVWIEGEASNLSIPVSGHIYFTLKDERAQLKVVMFRNSVRELKFKIEDGMQLLCRGKITVYEKGGQYQLLAESIEPKGVGALQMAFLQLKEKLEKEGLFDEGRKRALPFLPASVGIVTSATGAAIRDIIDISLRRFPNMHLVLRPVKVQGEGAAEEIAQAIEEFNEYGGVDVLIVGRGGGSLEDLWAFNEEVVARAIYNSVIPVVSAVGHQTDVTISDFVADKRAPTPSGAAEMVVPEKTRLAEDIGECNVRMRNALATRMSYLEEKLKSLSGSYVFKKPGDALVQYKQRVDDLIRQMSLGMAHFAGLWGQRLEVLKEKLQVLSPVAILSRGYSITLSLPGQETVREASLLKPGDRIETILHSGRIVSRIEKE